MTPLLLDWAALTRASLSSPPWALNALSRMARTSSWAWARLAAPPSRQIAKAGNRNFRMIFLHLFRKASDCSVLFRPHFGCPDYSEPEPEGYQAETARRR